MFNLIYKNVFLPLLDILSSWVCGICKGHTTLVLKKTENGCLLPSAIAVCSVKCLCGFVVLC